MNPIHCGQCNAELGTSDKTQENTQLCTPCAQERALEFSIVHGKVSNHDLVSDDKLIKTLMRIAIHNKEALQKGNFGERITKALRENTIL